MLCSGRRHGTAAVAALAVCAAVLGATLTGCAARTGPAVPQATAPGRTGQAAAQQAASREAASGAAVPWPSVAAGWVLDTYSAGTTARPAPTTLYLVSPAGVRYPLFTWPAAAQAPELFAWAGDKTQALVLLPPAAAGRPDGYGELNVLTGKVTPVAFPSAATTALGYTLPDGQQLLGLTPNGAGATIARYTQAGALVRTLVTGPGIGGASYSPDGAILAVAAPGGLELVSNAGGASTRLAVPGVSAKDSCGPVRWWNAATILAGCKSGLWLVPDSGARPVVLVPASDPGRPGYDLGDVDAWQLTSGRYLQSLGACGTVEVNKQAGDGTISRVTIPGMTYSPVVVTASATELLVEQRGCHGSGGELAWFNPATGAEQWIFRAGAGPAAVAYNNPANGGRF